MWIPTSRSVSDFEPPNEVVPHPVATAFLPASHRAPSSGPAILMGWRSNSKRA